jgi:hypothetical protein
MPALLTAFLTWACARLSERSTLIAIDYVVVSTISFLSVPGAFDWRALALVYLQSFHQAITSEGQRVASPTPTPTGAPQ